MKKIVRPAIPYMMDTPYYSAYDLSYKRRGLGNIQAMPYTGENLQYTQGTQRQTNQSQYNKETQDDITKINYMHGHRSFGYNHSAKSWGTQLTDVTTATIERRKDGKIKKYVHTPYVLSEEYISKAEHIRRVVAIVCSLLLVAGVAVFLLSYFNII